MSQEPLHIPACDQCQERPGTEYWIGDAGALAFAHGFYRRWCRRCVVRAQLAHAREQAALIPALEAELHTLMTV